MRPKAKLVVLLLALGLFWTTVALAQLLPPAGFDMTGYIQEATLDGTVAGTAAVPVANAAPNAGGTLTINSVKMLVPNNSIVQMPAAAFAWAQLFDPAVSASRPAGRPNHLAGQTGMAIMDTARTILPACEVRAVGNITPDPVTGTPRYIVGMILPVSGEMLNNVSGLITYINYQNGWFRVGGILNDPNSGAMVQINDPVGRFGKIHSRDPRFKCDTDNPTITTASGYPVGIPRVAPPAVDPLCPIYNRPLNGDPNFPVDPFLAVGAPLRTFTMPAPGGAPGTPDPTKQVPLMVGDWVDCQGTAFKQNPTGPNTAINWFTHAHSLTAHLGIQTQPGTNPVYVRVEEFLFGVGPKPDPVVGPVQETSSRAVLVAFATDPTLDATGSAIYAIQVDPNTGAETEVLFPNGNLNDASGLPTGIEMDDPIRGRMRLQLNKNNDATTGNAVGTGKYYREYIFRVGAGTSRQMPNVANGLTAGQYRLPIFDYIFAEGSVFGEPIPPFNFNDFGFLAVGNGPIDGTIFGRLDPWPGP